MKTYQECISCFRKQALESLRRSNATNEQYESAMKEVDKELDKIDTLVSPPETAQKIYHIIRNITGVIDPYAADKDRFNRFAMKLLPRLGHSIDGANDMFAAKVKFVIAANIIDFGKHNHLTEDDVVKCFDAAMEQPVDYEAIDRLRKAVGEAKNILYLCDNTGEIVFDRLLMEAMPLQKITCAVRGGPIINDATMEDAEFTGITSVVKTIHNGFDAPGTVLDKCSEEFRSAYNAADVVISKGQGNYETLSDIEDKRIFFLLQVKCPEVSKGIGLPVGTFVVMDNNAGTGFTS